MIIDFRVIYQSMDCSSLLPEDKKIYFINTLTDVVSQLSKGLDIPSTCIIVIPDNFEYELKEFQVKHNLVVVFTKNDMGTAYAKTLDYQEGDILKNAIFINKVIVFALLPDYMIETIKEQKSELIMLRTIAINTIHHELIHVYDNCTCGSQYEKLENYNDGIVKKKMRNIAIVVWQEYYACRRSALTYKMDLESEICNWKQQVLDVQEKIKEVINLYRLNGNIDVVDTELQIRIITLLKYTAYFQGHLFIWDNFGELCKLVQSINEQIASSFMHNVWSDMFNEFNELFNSYSQWDINALDRLSKSILKCWHNNGVYPVDTEDGCLFYSIPL